MDSLFESNAIFPDSVEPYNRLLEPQKKLTGAALSTPVKVHSLYRVVWSAFSSYIDVHAMVSINFSTREEKIVVTNRSAFDLITLSTIYLLHFLHYNLSLKAIRRMMHILDTARCITNSSHFLE